MNLPRAIICGFPRSGTTTLVSNLSRTSGIFIPEEQGFFGSNRTLRSYLEVFPEDAYCIDKSPGYIQSHEKMREIQKIIPDAKMVVCLRHPITSIMSLYHHRVEEFRRSSSAGIDPEKYPFSQMILDGRMFRGVGVQTYMHAQKIRDNLSFFPKENIHVILQERMKKDTIRTVKGCFSFLEFDCGRNVYGQDGIIQNTKGRYEHIDYNDPLFPFAMRFLLDTYEKPIEELKALLGDSLSEWDKQTRMYKKYASKKKDTFLIGISTSFRSGKRFQNRGEETGGSLLFGCLDVENKTCKITSSLTPPVTTMIEGRKSARGFDWMDEYIYVANASTIFKYACRDGEYIQKASYTNTFMADIHSIAVDRIRRRVYVTATGADMILVFDEDLNLVDTWDPRNITQLRGLMEEQRFDISKHDFRENLYVNQESFHINHVFVKSNGQVVINLPKVGIVWNITTNSCELGSRRIVAGNGTSHDGVLLGEYYYFSNTKEGHVVKIFVPTGERVTSVDCMCPSDQTTGSEIVTKKGWLRGLAHIRDELFLAGQIGVRCFLVDMSTGENLGLVTFETNEHYSDYDYKASVYTLQNLEYFSIVNEKKL